MRAYVEPRRALRPSRATVRFETEPARQLQHDWGDVIVPVGGKARRVHVAVRVLGYSRRFHVMAAPCCDAEHTYESLARAFAWFGGVTRQVWVDNPKSAVTAHVPGAVRFKQLARHDGFAPKACRPYRPRTKDKVERVVGYVKQHLPVHRFDTSYVETRQVGWDAYVNVRGNRYSVPSAYCGQMVTVHVSLDNALAVYAGERGIARHRLTPAEAGWQTVADHHARLWADVTVEARSPGAYEEVAHASAG